MSWPLGIRAACRAFERTPQAYYQARQHADHQSVVAQTCLAAVAAIRQDLPKLGTRKLQHLLATDARIVIGRDRLFTLLGRADMLIERKRCPKYVPRYTPNGQPFENLIIDLSITTPDQVWVSDITYLRVEAAHVFLALTTDAYSRKIIGWQLGTKQDAGLVLAAFDMAIDQRQNIGPTIHHSDQGTQYSAKAYASHVHQHGLTISMSQRSNPYQNAQAERLNGILKHEFGLAAHFTSIAELRKQVEQSIYLYNNKRPHLACQMNTPAEQYSPQRPKSSTWVPDFDLNFNPQTLPSKINL